MTTKVTAAQLASPGVARATAAYLGGGAAVASVVASGLALVATASKCNSSPDGDTYNPQWKFSGYCQDLALYHYLDPPVHADGLLVGIFAIPVLVVLCGTIVAIGLRRLTPLKWACYLSLTVIAGLFGLDVAFAHATFHGCC